MLVAIKQSSWSGGEFFVRNVECVDTTLVSEISPQGYKKYVRDKRIWDISIVDTVQDFLIELEVE